MHTQIDDPHRFTALPDEETLVATAAALEARGFSAEIVDDPDRAREAVLRGSRRSTARPNCGRSRRSSSWPTSRSAASTR